MIEVGTFFSPRLHNVQGHAAVLRSRAPYGHLAILGCSSMSN
jgi:hypothetical protein